MDDLPLYRDDLTREEIQAELRELGIDVAPAIASVKEAVAAARLRAAGDTRRRVYTYVNDIIDPSNGRYIHRSGDVVEQVRINGVWRDADKVKGDS